jgi:predicted ArsR family transcriptional regulator
MKVINPPVALSQWDGLLARFTTEVPPGFQSAAEIAKERGLSSSTVRHTLVELSRAGKVEIIVARPPGGRNPMSYYRPKNYEQAGQGKKHRSNR